MTSVVWSLFHLFIRYNHFILEALSSTYYKLFCTFQSNIVWLEVECGYMILASWCTSSSVFLTFLRVCFVHGRFLFRALFLLRGLQLSINFLCNISSEYIRNFLRVVSIQNYEVISVLANHIDTTYIL